MSENLDPEYVKQVCQRAVDKWTTVYKVNQVIPYRGVGISKWIHSGVVKDCHLEAFRWLEARV